MLLPVCTAHASSRGARAPWQPAGSAIARHRRLAVRAVRRRSYNALGTCCHRWVLHPGAPGLHSARDPSRGPIARDLVRTAPTGPGRPTFVQATVTLLREKGRSGRADGHLHRDTNHRTCGLMLRTLFIWPGKVPSIDGCRRTLAATVTARWPSCSVSLCDSSWRCSSRSLPRRWRRCSRLATCWQSRTSLPRAARVE